MSRRNLTLLLSSGLAVVLTFAAFLVQVPYVLLSGGPVYNTTGSVQGTDIIQISGRTTYPTDGQLDLTTVSVDRTITLAEALKGWWKRDQAVAPTELIYPPDKSEAEIRAENKKQMVESQNSSKSAALLQLGIPVVLSVRTITEGSPADGLLREGDVLRTVNGAAITSPDALIEAITAAGIGGTVTVAYERAEVPGQAVLTTASSGGDTARPVIGITYAITDYPFDITIALENVGGPSAGLMFSLGIIDELTPESLTAGRHIAGTGTIDEFGQVGPIGGIQQKMAAAGKLGVEVFLVPDANCPDAQANKPSDVQLVRVTTLESALTALETIREGGTPRGCAS